MTTISPYPLQWPDNRTRLPANRRVRSPFRTGFGKAVDNVKASLRGFQKDAGIRIEHVVLSTNVDLMNDNPRDAGAAVWFTMDGEWVAFAVDRFPDVASNVQAIHHIIEARRTELRYGGLEIVRQTFRSFVALPAPRGWREVLGFSADKPDTITKERIEGAYRLAAQAAHPDRPGGSHEAMAALNRARDEALREVCAK